MDIYFFLRRKQNDEDSIAEEVLPSNKTLKKDSTTQREGNLVVQEHRLADMTPLITKFHPVRQRRYTLKDGNW